jgi:hypothetical protein
MLHCIVDVQEHAAFDLPQGRHTWRRCRHLRLAASVCVVHGKRRLRIRHEDEDVRGANVVAGAVVERVKVVQQALQHEGLHPLGMPPPHCVVSQQTRLAREGKARALFA